MRIDFVSDVVCPWCAIGLASLDRALERLDGAVDVALHVQPFELNPAMGPDGEDIVEHLTRKYGLTSAQLAENRERIRQRGADVGFAFGERARTWNTFDAHRLLMSVADDPARQLALKRALLAAYHGRGENVGDPAVLARLADDVGLDASRARDVLASDAYEADVRARERFYADRGIGAVPAVIVDERHLISGGQPVDVYERALRSLAGDTAR